MPGARYVLLGLAQARSAWFREVSQWANAGIIGAEFIKCVSAEEVRARLGGARPFSALLVDGTLPTLDRDLIEAATDASCAVIVVGGLRPNRDWIALGAAAPLPAHFDRKDLLDALGAHAQMIGRADRAGDPVAPARTAGWASPLIAVTGPGGAGSSTAAIALAQGLASDVRDSGAVLLADLRRNADQAMLHDARDVVPSVQELVDAFRAGRPSAEDVRGYTFELRERGYQLLLGLRRSAAWATIRPRAFDAALAGMRSSHRAVVADVDPDLEGEDDGGSIDIEERHVMSRTVCGCADVVVVVGAPGMKGLFSLNRVITELLTFGVPASRVLPVVNRAPRGGRARAELAAALGELLPPWVGPGMASPIFLPERKIEEALRDGVRIPEPLPKVLAGAVTATISRAPDEDRRPDVAAQVIPGRLGAWASGMQS